MIARLQAHADLVFAHPTCDRMSTCNVAALELLARIAARTDELTLLTEVLNHEGLLDETPVVAALAMLTVHEAMRSS